MKLEQMKKLGKLSINPVKVIKNDELVNLRGGNDEDLAQISCYNVYQELVGCVNTPYFPLYYTQNYRNSYPSTYTVIMKYIFLNMK